VVFGLTDVNDEDANFRLRLALLLLVGPEEEGTSLLPSRNSSEERCFSFFLDRGTEGVVADVAVALAAMRDASESERGVVMAAESRPPVSFRRTVVDIDY